LAEPLHKSKPMPGGLSRKSLDFSYDITLKVYSSRFGVHRIRMDIKMWYSKEFIC
jgi:hypothetical protein